MSLYTQRSFVNSKILYNPQVDERSLPNASVMHFEGLCLGKKLTALGIAKTYSSLFHGVCISCVDYLHKLVLKQKTILPPYTQHSAQNLNRTLATDSDFPDGSNQPFLHCPFPSHQQRKWEGSSPLCKVFRKAACIFRLSSLTAVHVTKAVWEQDLEANLGPIFQWVVPSATFCQRQTTRKGAESCGRHQGS